MDDRLLIGRIAEGDTRSFAAIVDRYQQRLVGFAARMLGDSDAAQDVAQEAFIRLWRSRSGCSAETNVCGYLYKITRNLCLDHLRSRRLDASLDEASAIMQAEEGAPEEVARSIQLSCAVRQSVLDMPEEQREVFILSHYQQLTYGEIAAVIGCPLGTVASRKRQAVLTLRRRLRPWIEEETR